jgi:protein-L-isoaspartate O-methyltransferase
MNHKSNSDNSNFADPSPLMQLSTAYWDSQTFLTANRIGLFDVLANGAKSAEDIAKHLQTHLRPTILFLNACAALELLESREGLYINTPLSETYLVSNSPMYLGNAFRYSDNLYNTWGQLEHALRSNEPPMAEQVYTGTDTQKTRDFVYGMHNRAMGIGQAMLRLVDITGCRQMLDVGGGPGTYSALFAKRYSELHSKAIDLPSVVEIAAEILESMGAKDQVTLIAGDYHHIEFPGGNDVVLMSGIFHRESAQSCQNLIARGYDSLNAGGKMIVADVFTDKGGRSPLFSTLFGLNMFLTAPDGGVHSDNDVKTWMLSAGMSAVEIKSFPSPMPHRLLVGNKGER